MQRAIFAILLTALVMAAACQRIQEPWVRDGNLLEQERARAPETLQVLRQRVMWVQTDR